MPDEKLRCVNCGKSAPFLIKYYGPSIRKLTKCKYCKGIVDKYIEYDNVIVMIDIVLISKEAQRHVLYNTDFRSYWKLFIVLTLLETYGVWHNDSLLNIAINSLCGIKNKATVNTTYLELPINASEWERWQRACSGWVHEELLNDNDLFIWEKDFYIQFMSTFTGIFVFTTVVHVSLQALKQVCGLRGKSQNFRRNQVSYFKMLQAFSMANVSILFSLPMLVWGSTDTSAETRAVHYGLGFAYSFVMFYSTFTVLYETPTMMTLITLLEAYALKYLSTFYTTPLLRRWVA